VKLAEGLNMRLCFASPSTKFGCIRCAKCCSLDVSLTDEEIRNFCENVDLKWRTTKKVIKGNDLVCCFLDGNVCRIYERRPKICRVYPFFAICKEDLAALRVRIPKDAISIEHQGATYFITYDDQCPGLGGEKPNWKEVVAVSYSYTRESSRQHSD